MRKLNYLFTVITLVFTTIAISQTISSEEIRKRILKDSATYSWEQVNEFVNGLENEVKLDSAFIALKRENASLFNSYQSLEKRFVNYTDTIVPAYQQVIADKEANHSQLSVLYKDTEKLLGKQRFIKWVYAFVGILLGTVVGIAITI